MKLRDVPNTAKHFKLTGLTVGAIRSHIFKAEDRINSKGDRIPGNGLAESGAIIRVGRKVLIDVEKYGQWLAGGVK